MFPDLVNALNISNAHESGLVLAVSKGGNGFGGDSSFVLHHFISSILKQNSQKDSSGVVLIGLEHSFFHYSNIQRKLVRNVSLVSKNAREITLLMREQKELLNLSIY
jgi:hypothetical protein